MFGTRSLCYSSRRPCTLLSAVVPWSCGRFNLCKKLIGKLHVSRELLYILIGGCFQWPKRYLLWVICYSQWSQWCHWWTNALFRSKVSLQVYRLQFCINRDATHVQITLQLKQRCGMMELVSSLHEWRHVFSHTQTSSSRTNPTQIVQSNSEESNNNTRNQTLIQGLSAGATLGFEDEAMAAPSTADAPFYSLFPPRSHSVRVQANDITLAWISRHFSLQSQAVCMSVWLVYQS